VLEGELFRTASFLNDNAYHFENSHGKLHILPVLEMLYPSLASFWTLILTTLTTASSREAGNTEGTSFESSFTKAPSSFSSKDSIAAIPSHESSMSSLHQPLPDWLPSIFPGASQSDVSGESKWSVSLTILLIRACLGVFRCRNYLFHKS
jgi:hypothetical protein